MEDTKDSQIAFERYNQIVDILKEISDKKGLKLIQEIVEKAVNYIQITIEMEQFITMKESLGESTRQYQDRFKNLDQRKRLTHNALISQLNIVNRYLFSHKLIKNKIPIGGIFTGDPHNIGERGAIADWAYFLVAGLVNRRIIRL